MGNTFDSSLEGVRGQVQGHELVVAEVRIEASIDVRIGSQSDGQAAQCTAHLQAPTLEANDAVAPNDEHRVRGRIVDLGQASLQVPGTGCEALGGRTPAQRFMRTLAVVRGAPGVEAALHLGMVSEVAS